MKFRIAKTHRWMRGVFTWCANSRIPVVTRRLCDLSNDHIHNILIYSEYPGVTHIPEDALDMLKQELEGRSQGIYANVEEYG